MRREGRNRLARFCLPFRSLARLGTLVYLAAVSACGSSGSLSPAPDAMSGGTDDAARGDSAVAGDQGEDASAREGSAQYEASVDSASHDALAEGAVEAGAGSCRSNNDCLVDSCCRGPQDGPCMGTCLAATTCATDTQCEAGLCREVAPLPSCGGGAGSLFCSARCRGTTSARPRTPAPRTAIADRASCSTCPPYLSCVGGALNGLCQAKSCQSDGDCAPGYCVAGACQASLGSCEPRCG